MALGISVRQGLFPSELAARRKVLVVDENGKDRAYLTAILSERGYDVCACASAAEGSRCLERERYDFVVVSQGSRAFEGRSVLERIVDIDRRIPVLVLTRCVDMRCYIDAMQLGAVDYLEKPLAPSELLRVVETHLKPIFAAA
jgi:DNA-binding response OmpR family regulator